MAATTARAQQQADAPRNYWMQAGPKLAAGTEEFRLVWLHAGVSSTISDYVTSFSWTEDEQGFQRGDLTLTMPGLVKPVRLEEGDVIRCDVRKPGGAYSELWRQRLNTPVRNLKDGTTAVSLANDLYLMQESEDDFSYKKTKLHPRGWTFDQIIADVAKKYGIKTVVCPKGKHLITNLTITDDTGNEVQTHKASPLDVIRSAIKREQVATGKNYHVRYEKGVLRVLPRTRSALLIELGPTIMEAALTQSHDRQDKPFATALTVRNAAEETAKTDSKGHKLMTMRKVVVQVSSPAAIKKYGFIHRVVFAQDASTASEARSWGAAYLAKLARMASELTITHPGMSGIRRFDALRIKLDDPALSQIVFVQAVTHSVSGGVYTMDVTLQFEDPFVDAVLDKITEDIVDVANTKKRVAPKAKAKTPPTPATNTKRKDSFSSNVGAAGRGG